MPTQSIRCVNAYVGVVSLDTDAADVQQLRNAIADAMGIPEQADQLKLIVGGRHLKDEQQTLKALRFTANTRVMVMHSKPEAAEQLRQQEERARTLDSIKAQAAALAERSGDTYSRVHQLEFALENQAGSLLQFPNPDDQKAVTMGLFLHERAKLSMKKGDYALALEELQMAEEAFDLTDQEVVGKIDNVPLLLLDLVWCMYKLGENRRLATASSKLHRARTGLTRTYGEDLSRLTQLHGGFKPQLTVFLRLDLMDAVAAYLRGDHVLALKHLQAARVSFQQLQVDPDKLMQLMSMGYSHSLARRALRFSAGDMLQAFDFIEQSKVQEAARKKQRQDFARKRKRQRSFGQTDDGKYVELEYVERIVSMGYGDELAAEALKKTNNDVNKAIDLLTDPLTFDELQVKVSSRKAKGKDKAAPVPEELVQRLTGMGFRPDLVRQVLQSQAGDESKALDELVALGDEARDWNALVAGSSADGGAAPSSGAGPSVAPDDPAVAAQQFNEAEVEEPPLLDEELEQEMYEQGEDPMRAYDVDVSEEGALLEQYCQLLALKAPSGS